LIFALKELEYPYKYIQSFKSKLQVLFNSKEKKEKENINNVINEVKEFFKSIENVYYDYKPYSALTVSIDAMIKRIDMFIVTEINVTI